MERTSYRPSTGERPSTAVINAIAEHEDTDPGDVGPQLYDVVDPDALDSLFSSTIEGKPRSTGRAMFTYRGHRIAVHSNGRVSVEVASEAKASSETETASADE